MAQCGACTIHVDGNAVRSCILPVAQVENKEVITIEGLSKEGDHPVSKLVS
jgi:isoquinoline 1-oxidoreductase subunit alpha